MQILLIAFCRASTKYLISRKRLGKHTSTNVVIVILFYMSEKLKDLIDVQCNSKILTNQYLENMNHGLIFISAVELSMKDQRCCSIENSRRRIQNKVCPLLTWIKRTLKKTQCKLCKRLAAGPFIPLSWSYLV